jgi:predicted tellurium resistance membrane protein TerC
MIMQLLSILPDLSSPQTWISLLTLTFLEIVLGIDNIIFISIVSNKLAAGDQGRARNIGLALAMILRIILLMAVSYLVAMQAALFSIHNDAVDGDFSGQSLILAAGGLFLLYKSTSEIHHKLEGSHADDAKNTSKAGASFTSVILQITLINVVFSFDSILTAIGLTKDFSVMVIAIVASVLIMMAFAGAVGQFVNRHPTIQMLGLAFLILIGFMLIAEGAHLAHLKIFGAEVGAVPKGYLYFAIAFSLFVEFLNIRLRRKPEPVQLHGIQQTAVEEGLIKP